jgi:hypothetical protein
MAPWLGVAVGDEVLDSGFLKGDSGGGSTRWSMAASELSESHVVVGRSSQEWWRSRTMAGGGCRW